MQQMKFTTPESRWAGVGPYYAMFPTSFANDVVERFTEPGDIVLDPFAGRFTSIYSAAINGRGGLGLEVNPVGWVYGKAKISPSSIQEVSQRLYDVENYSRKFSKAANDLPIFFHLCFSRRIRMFLLAARDILNWRRRASDWTLMALLLVYLHGKINQSLSNQMRQTKSMAPEYAVNWWKLHKFSPPEIDPVKFMKPRIDWRYAKGTPKLSPSRLYLGNCGSIMPRLPISKPAKLLFTSPPYFGVTNYHYDQWIRLWLLGFPAFPNSSLGPTKGRFNNTKDYSALLVDTFSKASRLLVENAIVYVRTDKRQFTFETTKTALKGVFPTKKMTIVRRPFLKQTQTHLFGDKTKKVGEVDIILKP